MRQPLRSCQLPRRCPLLRLYPLGPAPTPTITPTPDFAASTDVDADSHDGTTAYHSGHSSSCRNSYHHTNSDSGPYCRALTDSECYTNSSAAADRYAGADTDRYTRADRYLDAGADANRHTQADPNALTAATDSS